MVTGNINPWAYLLACPQDSVADRSLGGDEFRTTRAPKVAVEHHEIDVRIERAAAVRGGVRG
jgi:hypothetical protein